MNNETRIKLEQRIVRKYIKALKDGGFQISHVTDYYGEPLNGIADLFACDDARVFVTNGKINGWLLFVYGNEPGEVLSDYTVNLEEYVAPINAWSDQFM